MIGAGGGNSWCKGPGAGGSGATWGGLMADCPRRREETNEPGGGQAWGRRPGGLSSGHLGSNPRRLHSI